MSERGQSGVFDVTRSKFVSAITGVIAYGNGDAVKDRIRRGGRQVTVPFNFELVDGSGADFHRAGAAEPEGLICFDRVVRKRDPGPVDLVPCRPPPRAIASGSERHAPAEEHRDDRLDLIHQPGVEERPEQGAAEPAERITHRQ